MCGLPSRTPAHEFSTLLEVTEVGTIYSHERCTRPTYFGFEKGEMGVKVISVCDMYYEPLDLEVSTLLEVTEAVTLYVHASCTWPTMCTHVALEIKGPKSRLNLRIFGQNV